MSELKMGFIVGSRMNEKGGFIDILGMDGVYYPNVEMFSTPGLNEMPVPSNIPIRDPSKLNFVTMEPELPAIGDLLSAPTNSFVLYMVYGGTQNQVQQVIPIKIFKNYAQESSSPPKLHIRPQPGEVAVQAAGTELIPGGFLYLNKTGDVTLSSAGTCSLSFTEQTGLIELTGLKTECTIPPFTLSIKDGSLKITKKTYTGPGSFMPTVDTTIEISPIGEITVSQTPGGTIPMNTIKISPTGEITVDSKTKISMSAPNISFNSGVLGVARETDPIIATIDMTKLVSALAGWGIIPMGPAIAPTPTMPIDGIIKSGSTTVKSG